MGTVQGAVEGQAEKTAASQPEARKAGGAMSNRFLLVTIGDRTVPRRELNKLFEKASDYHAATEETWVLWTRFDATKWRDRLAKVLGNEASFFVVEFDDEKMDGSMENDFWEFFGYEAEELENDD